MKRRERGSVLLAFLLIVAATLTLVILTGTVWALANRGAAGGSSLKSGSNRDPSAALLSSGLVDGMAILADIGTLRIPMNRGRGDGLPVTVVLTPFLPYPADDIAFREELVSKTRSIRAAIRAWFSARTLEEIETLGESAVKDALLAEINGLLVLGSVGKLFFTEYMVLD